MPNLFEQNLFAGEKIERSGRTQKWCWPEWQNSTPFSNKEFSI